MDCARLLKNQKPGFETQCQSSPEIESISSELQMKELNTPQGIIPKQLKLNTQKITFQNLMNEDFIEQKNPLTKTNKLKISTDQNYLLFGSKEEDYDEIAIIEKQMKK